jgi:dTDP-4-dehydrorhamnose reductase
LTLLVLGAGGQVGRALVERAGPGTRGFDRAACDICDEASVARALSVPMVTAVVNCAAYTAVDRAESDPEGAYAINAEGAGIVARASAARGLPIIHLSTDYVYAGTCVGSHREDEPVAPVNVYGASKAAGDAAVAAGNPAHLLLRVSWVFSVYGANFVKTMLRLGCERDELRVVADQRGGPTEARDIPMQSSRWPWRAVGQVLRGGGSIISRARQTPTGTASPVRFSSAHLGDHRG